MNSDEDLEQALRDGDVSVSRRHDAAVLRAARSAAADIATRPTASNDQNSPPPGWRRWSLALAASFALGIAVTVAMQGLRGPFLGPAAADGTLTIPVTTVTRDNGDPTAKRLLPVSEADPQLWLEYIQELVYNGELAAAEQHIGVFRQMHPGYHYIP